MKKLTILFVFCFVAGISSTYAQGFGLGIKGGLNFANVDVSGADGKTGYHFGAYGRASLGKIGLQPELLFSARGADDFDLTYVDIPILLTLKVAGPISLHAGPQFSLLTKAEDPTGDIKNQLKSSEFAVAAGVQLDLPMGLSAALRYVSGLSDINDAYTTGSVKNGTFQLSVGFQLVGLGN